MLDFRFWICSADVKLNPNNSDVQRSPGRGHHPVNWGLLQLLTPELLAYTEQTHRQPDRRTDRRTEGMRNAACYMEEW